MVHTIVVHAHWVGSLEKLNFIIGITGKIVESHISSSEAITVHNGSKQVMGTGAQLVG